MRNLNRYFRTSAFRIALAYAGLFATSVAILFAGLYWSVTSELHDVLEAEITADVDALTQRHEAGGTAALEDLVRLWVADAAGRGGIYGINPPGLANHPALPSFTGWRTVVLDDLEGPTDEAADEADDGGDDDGGDDDALGDRGLLYGFTLGDRDLIVGRGLDRVEETTELLIDALTVSLSLTVVLALAGGLLFSRSTVRRIAVIGRTTEAIVAGDIARRIPVDGRNDELTGLARNINHMLDRIEALMAGLRQVSDDIAHDLRTPLGRLRQKLERAHREETTVDGCKTALAAALEEADALLETFGALLRIAQIEAGARKSRFTTVDLSALAGTIAEAYGDVAEAEGYRLATSIAPDITIHGDNDLLAQALANLLDNALTHTPPETEVSLRLHRDDEAISLIVADGGPGIPAAERERVLTRFYRLEQSRTTPGNGLGLAMVKAIADLHGAALALEDNTPGLSIVLRFPNPGAVIPSGQYTA